MDFVAVLRVVCFFLLMAIPQILGILVHFRMKKFPRAAYFVGFAITMLATFSLLTIIFVPEKSEEMCGLGAMAVAFFILFFLLLQAVASIIAQLVFRSRYRS
ncbi:MAG: hypothetical protein LUM44_12780 [Pyrinomonadaceae bacterium]|nr:hypothetical protein [Pyrinomonadaceae bacterium]